uniref:Uncharacterized protein n=1 Tax=Anguilla anguilla TaxID=7936 RepID=A0A0E9XCS3_ANGAN
MVYVLHWLLTVHVTRHVTINSTAVGFNTNNRNICVCNLFGNAHEKINFVKGEM